jgi:hypothetical protein
MGLFDTSFNNWTDADRAQASDILQSSGQLFTPDGQNRLDFGSQTGDERAGGGPSLMALRTNDRIVSSILGTKAGFMQQAPVGAWEDDGSLSVGQSRAETQTGGSMSPEAYNGLLSAQINRDPSLLQGRLPPQAALGGRLTNNPGLLANYWQQNPDEFMDAVQANPIPFQNIAGVTPTPPPNQQLVDTLNADPSLITDYLAKDQDFLSALYPDKNPMGQAIEADPGSLGRYWEQNPNEHWRAASLSPDIEAPLNPQESWQYLGDNGFDRFDEGADLGVIGSLAFNNQTTTYLENQRENATIEHVDQWFNGVNAMFSSNPEAFAQWEQENPEMAIRWHSQVGERTGSAVFAPGSYDADPNKVIYVDEDGNDVTEADLFPNGMPSAQVGNQGFVSPTGTAPDDHTARAGQLAFGLSQEAGFGEDGKNDNKMFAYNYEQFNNIGSADNVDDFWKVGTLQTQTNSLGDYLQDNWDTVLGLVGATVLTGGAAGVAAGAAGGAATAAGAAASAGVGAAGGAWAQGFQGLDIDSSQVLTTALLSAVSTFANEALFGTTAGQAGPPSPDGVALPQPTTYAAEGFVLDAQDIIADLTGITIPEDLLIKASQGVIEGKGPEEVVGDLVFTTFARDLLSNPEIAAILEEENWDPMAIANGLGDAATEGITGGSLGDVIQNGLLTTYKDNDGLGNVNHPSWGQPESLFGGWFGEFDFELPGPFDNGNYVDEFIDWWKEGIGPVSESIDVSNIRPHGSESLDVSNLRPHGSETIIPNEGGRSESIDVSNIRPHGPESIPIPEVPVHIPPFVEPEFPVNIPPFVEPEFPVNIGEINPPSLPDVDFPNIDFPDTNSTPVTNGMFSNTPWEFPTPPTIEAVQAARLAEQPDYVALLREFSQ